MSERSQCDPVTSEWSITLTASQIERAAELASKRLRSKFNGHLLIDEEMRPIIVQAIIESITKSQKVAV